MCIVVVGGGLPCKPFNAACNLYGYHTVFWLKKKGEKYKIKITFKMGMIQTYVCINKVAIKMLILPVKPISKGFILWSTHKVSFTNVMPPYKVQFHHDLITPTVTEVVYNENMHGR